MRRSRWSEASGPPTRSSRRSTGRAFPTRAGGEEAADQVSSWANGARNDLEEAEDLLDDEPDSLEDDVERVTEIARLIAGVLESGRQTLATVGTSDPELEAAFRDSSTCQQLRAETG